MSGDSLGVSLLSAVQHVSSSDWQPPPINLQKIHVHLLSLCHTHTHTHWLRVWQLWLFVFIHSALIDLVLRGQIQDQGKALFARCMCTVIWVDTGNKKNNKTPPIIVKVLFLKAFSYSFSIQWSENMKWRRILMYSHCKWMQNHVQKEPFTKVCHSGSL